MRLIKFSTARSEPITLFESVAASSRLLADGRGDAHVHCLHFEPGGKIGEHSTGFGQLFLVIAGSDWAAGADGRRVEVHTGQAVYFERGERHSKGSDRGMMVLMVQVTDLQLHVSGGGSMGATENKALVRSFLASGNNGELERCLELIDDRVVWTNIGTTKLSGKYEGKEALIKELLGPVFGKLKSGIRTTVDNMVAEGDFVVVQSKGQAETTEGQQYNNTYCHVFRIGDGKILEVTEYMDTELVSSVLCR